MKLIYIIAVIAFAMAIINILSTVVKIVTGTKLTGKCIGFVSVAEAIQVDAKYFGSVFEFEDNGKIIQTYTMSQFKYPLEAEQKILVQDSDNSMCYIISELNRNYIQDLITLTISCLVVAITHR